MVVARGSFWEGAVVNANRAVVGLIKGLSLRVTPEKTKAVLFHDGSVGPSPRTQIIVDKIQI